MMPTALRAVLCACLFACLSAVLPAAPIVIEDPIAIMGSLYFTQDENGSYWYGITVVGETSDVPFEITTNGLYDGPALDIGVSEFCATGQHEPSAGWYSFGRIGLVTGGNLAFCVGGERGVGSLSLYDGDGTLTASIKTLSRLDFLSIQSHPGHTTTNYVVVPTPEPSTWALAGVSLLGLVWWRRRQYPASVQR